MVHILSSEKPLVHSEDVRENNDPVKNVTEYTISKWQCTNVNDMDFLPTLKPNSTTRWSVPLKTAQKGSQTTLFWLDWEACAGTTFPVCCYQCIELFHFLLDLDQWPPAKGCQIAQMFLVTARKPTLLKGPKCPQRNLHSLSYDFI